MKSGLGAGVADDARRARRRRSSRDTASPISCAVGNFSADLGVDVDANILRVNVYVDIRHRRQRRHRSDCWIQRLRRHRGKSGYRRRPAGGFGGAGMASGEAAGGGTGASSGVGAGAGAGRRFCVTCSGVDWPASVACWKAAPRLGLRHGRSGGFNADQRGGGKQRNGNKEDGKQGAAAAGGKGLAEAGFVKQALNALGKMTGAGHGNSCKGWARESREFKQELSVGGAAGGHFKAGAIADGFAQFREFAFEPPSQGAEPEEGGIETGKKLQIEVALANMGALVGQNDAQLLLIPLGVIGGQTQCQSRY